MTTIAIPTTVPTVPRLWPGSTIVIFGGGPSLTPEDVAYCRGKARTIAIKEAYLLAPWADVLYACDHSWWLYYDGAPTFAGLKYGLETGHRTWSDVTILANTGHDGIETDPAGLRTGHNSGYQAVNLAVHLGARRIVLLGFDMWNGGPDGRANWHASTRPHRDSPYAIFLQRFSEVAEPLRALGIEVVNCSRTTILRAFPRMPLEEALP